MHIATVPQRIQSSLAMQRKRPMQYKPVQNQWAPCSALLTSVQCSEVGDTLYMFDGVVKPASIGHLHSDHVLNRSQPLHCNLQKTAQYFVLWMHYAYILEPELHQNALNQSLFSIRIEMQCNWIKMRLQCALCIALWVLWKQLLPLEPVTWHS